MNQLREQEGILKTYVDLLMYNLHEDAKKGEDTDIVAALNWTTFDVIGDLSFAESFHNLELRRSHEWLSTVFDSIRLAVTLHLLNSIGFGLLIKLLQMLMRKESGFHFMPYSVKRVDERIKQGTTRPDFMSHVLEHNREDGTGITRDEINATMAVIVMAGSETTATSLAGSVYLLLRNPDKMKKLREEILSEFKSVDDITIMRTSRLPYLFAVIEESLRIYPPVPVALSRTVPPEGASICGYWIPGGVSSSRKEISFDRKELTLYRL
jgi:cytochrome P450